MTDDDLDLLASVYLDGEATPEEVAMVERDPDLMARVAELRAISEQVSITPAPSNAAMKEQHLAAALAEFTATGTAQQEGAGQTPQSESSVPSLAEKRREREARKAERSSSQRMPQWLTAAAAFILIGGGVIFLAGRTGSDDTTEAAFDTTDDSDDASDEAASSAMVESDSPQQEAMPAADSDATAEDAMEEEAMDDSAMDEAAEEGAFDEVTPRDDDDGASSSEAAPSTTATSRTGGLFPEDPVMSYSSVPDPDSVLAELPDPRPDLLASRCGLDLNDEIDLEIIGYLPIEIAGEPAEVFAVLTQDGSDSAIIVDENCEELAPGN
ncbi:MAG: hypothetical protein ACRBK7_08650 [Acidimicrobiales bacterium]